MTVHKLHTLKIHGTGMASAIIVRDLLDAQLDLAPDLAREVTAAQSTPDHVAMKAQNNRLTVSTYDLVQVLDAIGVVGLGITSGANPGVVLYSQKFDDVGQAVSGSYHRSYTLGTGLIVPKSLSCDHQGDFKLSLEMPILWDGTNNPVVLSDTAALPSITQAAARWTLGPMKIGNVALGKYTNVSIDFGNNVTTRGEKSDIWPTHIDQRTHEPMITITGIDPTWFVASGGVPIGGIVAANATDYVMLRKRTQDGDHFVGDATAEHIKFTLAGLAAISGAAQLQAQRVSETSLVIAGAKDSSGNMPIVVDTTSAIP